MRLFRRRQTLNERLAREGGLLPPRGGEDTRSPWDKAGIHGVHRPREWDEVVTVQTELEGDVARFVVLEDEIVIEEGPDDVEPLTEPVATQPPYRAEARRVEDGLWTVGARAIEVVSLPALEGEEFQLVSRDGFQELTVDEQRVFGSIPELAREGDFVVRGRRLDTTLWEIETSPL